MERHEPSGQFYNWYDPVTLAKLTIWPEPTATRCTRSCRASTTAGWPSALIMVANAVPQLHDRAWALATSMDFGCYYDPNAKADRPGLIRGGFWLEGESPPDRTVFPRGDYCGMGEDVVYTGHHYGAFNTEPRIASYIGIALGQIPRGALLRRRGARSPTRATGRGRSRSRSASGRTYLGVDVFEGAYRYDDQRIVPTWGGSMFEALMVPLVVPEEEWGPAELGRHPSAVRRVADRVRPRGGRLRLLGFSPASNPAGGYREYGVDAIGMEPNGYTADVERHTLVDYGWDDPACPRPRVAAAHRLRRRAW